MGVLLVLFLLVMLIWPLTRVYVDHATDRRTDLVKELDLTPMGAHLLGVPYKKRR